MNIKMKWKRLLTGFLCMMLLASNAGSVFAEDTDIYNPTVSGNDISGNDSKGESGEPEAEKSGTDKNGGEEPGREVDAEAGEAMEDLPQPLSLEADGYDTSAADRTYTAGKDIKAYYFEADGMLVLEGTGEMDDWNEHTAPWSGNTIRKVHIKEGITTVGTYAFFEMEELSDIHFPNSLRTIGAGAFMNNSSLEAVVIPDSVTEIGEIAFSNCAAIGNISLGSGVETIGREAFFADINVKNIEIPDSVEEIGEAAFHMCFGLEGITIGNGVKTIGKMAFADCMSLKTVSIPDNVTAIGENAFARCSMLTEIFIGCGVEQIGDGAFYLENMTKTGIRTANAVAEGYNWSNDNRERIVNFTVIFQDHDGSILVQKEMAYGTLLPPLAPVSQRADEGLDSYTFCCWSPTLHETDVLTGDITYTALYRRKTQTGIQISYEENMTEGTPVNTETIKVYPVYQVFDENDKLIEMIWDEKAVIGRDDARFSKDYLERGSNEILIEQISTGLMITADIFGSYIDGITVRQPPVELEAGTELRELEVYFTRTIEDKAGFIVNNFPDLTKKVEKYELDKKDSVTIKEGDNEICVTEKESGEEHECTVHITGIPKKTGDGGDDTEKDPEGDVSGNNPTDKKDETTSGNDPADKKDETASGGSGGKEPDINTSIPVSDTVATKPGSSRHHAILGITGDPGPDTTGKEQDLADMPDDGTAIRKTGEAPRTGDGAYAGLPVTAAAVLACVVLLILILRCRAAEER